VASVVALARAVGVAVVAEGVETAIQAAILQRLGCVHAQGRLWSQSVPVSALLGGDRWSTPLPSANAANADARANGEHDAGVAHGLRRLFELHQDGASVATIAATLDAEAFRTPARPAPASQQRRGGHRPADPSVRGGPRGLARYWFRVRVLRVAIAPCSWREASAAR
jgi:hypothetical protein